jgi:hypothetical protein
MNDVEDDGIGTTSGRPSVNALLQSQAVAVSETVSCSWLVDEENELQVPGPSERIYRPNERFTELAVTFVLYCELAMYRWSAEISGNVRNLDAVSFFKVVYYNRIM